MTFVNFKKMLRYFFAALLAFMAVYLIWNLPEWLLPPASGLSLKESIELINETRRTLVLFLGSIVVLGGLYLIFLRMRTVEKNVLISGENQTIELFSRAIDQLGTYKLEVQLGGIFALERLATASEKDHWAIIEIFMTYVRENAQWIERDDDSNGKLDEDTEHVGKLPGDIQAILTVLGRRRWLEQEIEQGKFINLRKANLSFADLRGANLARANLRGVNLDGANLMEADLSNAFLGEANLKRANLAKANLQGASFVGANLEGASFKGSDLSGAQLMKTNLKGAIFTEAKLESANFLGADLERANLGSVILRNANLDNTNLKRIRYDYETAFPDWINLDMREELRMELKQ